ncbi:hypothetical protein CKA32_000817 [Geitlerinema sp. FC II]|nr:hypothetical protein CKA32_000817 [Geitlerinema sp. FC II]
MGETGKIFRSVTRTAVKTRKTLPDLDCQVVKRSGGKR